jgi:hypothetical protein
VIPLLSFCPTFRLNNLILEFGVNNAAIVDAIKTSRGQVLAMLPWIHQ